jgi:hypothetical protein
MKDLFKLRDDGPPVWKNSEGLRFALDRPGDEWQRYRFVDDHAECLAETGHFERVSGDRLEDLLGGTAEEAADAVAAGQADDILDAVLVAERAHDSRVTVLQAVMERSDQLATENAQLQPHEKIDPREIVTHE